MNRFVAVVAFIALFAAGCGQSRESEDVLAPGEEATDNGSADSDSGDGNEDGGADEDSVVVDSPQTDTTLPPFTPPTTGVPTDVAVSVDFGDSTWEFSHGELNELVVPTWESEDFVNLVFRGVPPADFTQSVLNETLFAQVVEAELVASGGQVTEQGLAESEAALLTQVEGLYVGSADPTADAARLYGEAPYLAFLVRYQAAQNALTDLLTETAESTETVPCVSHILVATEEEATTILARLDGGEDFATLAMELSTGPSGPDGGNLGCSASSGYVPEFAAAVDNATIGEYIGPVQTNFGFHVLVVDRLEDAPVDVRAAASERLQARVLGATVEVDEKLGTWDTESLAIVPPDS